MAHSHSLLPVDHWTTGLADAQLRGLVERHEVHFEVGPHRVARGAGTMVRHGWVVDLYAARSAYDRALHDHEAARHLHDVLHALARAVVPPPRHDLAVELERVSDAVRVDPRRDFREEVRLRILIEPMTSADEPGDVDVEGASLEHVITRLAQLGCRRG